jgi:anthranilate/para-aminobenzoate synthase component I
MTDQAIELKSVTNPCDEDANVDKVVLRDPKLSHEHALSVSVQRKRLLALGLVDSARAEVLSLGRLRHIVTAFTTRPGVGTSIVQCLAAVLPCGASPCREGLALLSQLEEVGRGAYYGLIGVIAPDGSFEFCQVIRAYFGDKNRAWSWVGAGITIISDPDDEFEETCWKLDDCPRIFKRNVRI